MGCAGFLEERAALKQRGVPVGESILFFGCRDPLQDFLYEDELRGFETAEVTRLFSAFSREPGKPKTYVQHSIEAHGLGVAPARGCSLRLRGGLADGARRSAGL
jgi:sulfite reductase alpha subunit-like flavoprotein